MVLRRHPEIERRILESPLYRPAYLRSRRLSLQPVQLVQAPVEPIIQQLQQRLAQPNQATGSIQRPAPKRRASVSIQRPSLDDFLREINQSVEQKTTSDQTCQTQQRSSAFFSRGRRISSTSTSSIDNTNTKNMNDEGNANKENDQNDQNLQVSDSHFYTFLFSNIISIGISIFTTK